METKHGVLGAVGEVSGLSKENDIIGLTDSAVREVRRLLEKEGKPELFLRLGVQGGGCSGLSYKLAFEKRQEGDNLFETNGVQVVIDPKSTIYIKGTVLDYQEGLEGKGFVFKNPNASGTCGCGESFSI